MLEPLQVLAAYPKHSDTLNSMLASRASAVGEQEFLVFGESSWSYCQTLQAVERVAAMLHGRGIKAGDRVAVMSLNHPCTVFTFFAMARLGAVMVPINPEFRAEETRYVLTHAEVSGIVCSPAALETVRQALAGTPLRPWLLLNEEPARSTADAAQPAAIFDSEVQRTAASAPAEVESADSPCVFIYTSGTTGFPKGVMHSQRNVVLAGEGFVQRMLLQPSDRLMCILPMFHINALFYSLTGALAAGATLVLISRFSASRFWIDAARHRATQVNTMAAVSTILMRRPRDEFVAGHSLRKIYGAPFTAEIHRIFREEFAVPTLIEGYGMSEIPGALNNPFLGPHKVGSMGMPSRHPDPNVRLAELRVVDDGGAELADGQTGELIVKTPMVMRGYYRDPEQTAAAFRDGWFLTGDLAWRDADGYFWFVARKQDIIRRRGENISGAELDRILELHPDVVQAAAIPVPNDLGDDEILVAATLRPGATLTEKDLADWVRSRLAASKVPRYVIFVDALPQTPTHRVAKFKLRGDTTLRQRAVDFAARAP
ncbi:MAG: AMP-binding protein [Burkholderiaceae bacterium]